MTALLIAAWARFKGYIVAIGTAFALVAMVFYRGKSAGREQAETKQREVDHEARTRMDAVKPADSGSTIDSLRKGKF